MAYNWKAVLDRIQKLHLVQVCKTFFAIDCKYKLILDISNSYASFR